MNLNLAERITLLDTVGNKLVAVCPNEPLLSSAKAGWVGLKLEHHLIAPAEVSEVSFHDYGICLELNRAETAEELRFKYLCGISKGFAAAREIGIVSPFVRIAEHSWKHHLETLYLHVETAFVNRIAAETADFSRCEIHPNFSVHDKTIEQFASMFKSELQAGCPNGRLFAESLTVALVIHLLRRYSTTKIQALPHSNGLLPIKLRRVTEYINDNLESDLKLSDISEIAGLSRFYFARLFKASTGVSLFSYVQMQRVNRAKILLANSKLTVTEICHQVGFESHSRFSAAFRRITGVSPTTYRQSL